MKILITGGAGFQGSHLADYLIQQGHTISILNTFSEKGLSNLFQIQSKINIIWGSVTDNNLVDRTVRGHDVVFHLAANINVDHSLQDPYSFIQVNLHGTYNVLQAARNHNARLIIASTCEVYGDGHDLKENELLGESAELRPNSPYAASKAAADRFCHAYWKSYGVDVTIIRPFNIYGERQKSGTFGALIPILVKRAMDGKNLTVFGDGSATRDYLHISDIVLGYALILDRNDLQGKVVNFASGTNTKVKDIAEYIAQKFNVGIDFGPARPGEVTRFPADISFAQELGFSPKVSIWHGIDRYINWVKQQPSSKVLVADLN